MLASAVVEMAVLVPCAAFFFRAPPEAVTAAAGSGSLHKAAVLGLRPNTMFTLMVAAAFMCCVPMAMPQSHLVAFCTDLGIAPTHSAAMLSVVLGTAFVTRQFWGLISDRIGGLVTVLAGSAVHGPAPNALPLPPDEMGVFSGSAPFPPGFICLHPASLRSIRRPVP